MKQHIAIAKVQREASRRWPDKVLPFGAVAQLADEFDMPGSTIRRILHTVGYRAAPHGSPTLMELRCAAFARSWKARHGIWPSAADYLAAGEAINLRMADDRRRRAADLIRAQEGESAWPKTH